MSTSEDPNRVENEMRGKGFKIDWSESFEHLPHAPLVEAVIHWRARAERTLEPGALLEQLKARLPEYPNQQRQQEIGVGADIGPEGASLQQRHTWHGCRFESADKLHHSAALGMERVLLEELAEVREECSQPDWDAYNALPVSRDSRG